MSVQSQKHIRLDIKDKIARITIARPPINIFNLELMHELNNVLESLQNEDIKLLVLSAEGKMFSAGVDVKDHTEEKVEEMLFQFHKIFENLMQLDVPTIALVKGAALGGGCELATFCDFVIASENATFAQPEVKVGVFPPVAAVKFAPLVGLKKALSLILTGDTVSATEAEKIGLITKCVPEEKFDEYAEQFVQKIASLSGAVLKLARKCIYDTQFLPYEKGIKKAEELYLHKLMATQDAKEGLDAFIAKRKPVWKDK